MGSVVVGACCCCLWFVVVMLPCQFRYVVARWNSTPLDQNWPERGRGPVDAPYFSLTNALSCIHEFANYTYLAQKARKKSKKSVFM